MCLLCPPDFVDVGFLVSVVCRCMAAMIGLVALKQSLMYVSPYFPEWKI